MNRRLLIVAIAIGALVLMPVLAGAGDLEDLKATWDSSVEAFNSMNVERHFDAYHNLYVSGFSEDVLITGHAKAATLSTSGFEENEVQRFDPINAEYRIIGGTGLVYGIAYHEWKRKGEPAKTMYVRFLNVLVKQNGKWKIIAITHVPVSVGE